MFELDEMKKGINKELEKEIDYIFSDWQEKLNITDGTTDPFEEMRLDDLMRELTDQIICILQMQPREEKAETESAESEKKHMIKVKVIETAGNYTLLEKYDEHTEIADGFFGYSVVENYKENLDDWSNERCFLVSVFPSDPQYHLHKLRSLARAMDYLLYKAGVEHDYKGDLEDKLYKQTISYDRLIEIATGFKDAIINVSDDDEYLNAYTEKLDMTDEEKEFFGLEEKYDEYEVEIEQTIKRRFCVAVKKGDGEDKAIEIAEDLFEDIDYNQDMEIEYGNYEASSRFIGTYDKDNINYENDLDEL